MDKLGLSIDWTLLPNPESQTEFRLQDTDAPTPWIRVSNPWPSGSLKHLQITAMGSWTHLQIGECGPDGLQKSGPFPADRLTVANCPVGALIGKFGGSSTSVGPTSALPVNPPSPLVDGQAFAVGSYCLVAIPPNSIGPLFVAFNGLTGTIRIKELAISVEGAGSRE
jgi:hypothetical protein